MFAAQQLTAWTVQLDCTNRATLIFSSVIEMAERNILEKMICSMYIGYAMSWTENRASSVEVRK